MSFYPGAFVFFLGGGAFDLEPICDTETFFFFSVDLFLPKLFLKLLLENIDVHKSLEKISMSLAQTERKKTGVLLSERLACLGIIRAQFRAT